MPLHCVRKKGATLFSTITLASLGGFLIIFIPLETGMNTPQSYAVHFVEPIVPNFRRKSFNVRFFHYLLEYSFAVFWQKIFDIFMGFIKNVSSNSI